MSHQYLLTKFVLGFFTIVMIGGSLQAQAQDDRIDRLEQRLAALEHRITLQEDVHQVRQVAFTYAYLMDNVLYDQVIAMFSKNIESCEISGYGVFKGYDGCVRMWKDLIGKPLGADDGQLAFGRLAKHYMIKDVVTVSPDGKTATGRFDYLSAGGALGADNYTGSQLGIYTLDFVKENDVWKLSKFWLVFDTINYNHRDWASNPRVRCPSNTVKPDGPSTFHHPFPETGVVPFHYPNPVTGEPIETPVTDTKYWIGNWPGEFGGPCGKRSDFEKAAE
ncbi:hypothetical protein NBRC116494_19980 [Aurantivibrio plasticivorans]